MPPTLRQFFSYFGSKKRNARFYPTPDHEVLIEPFAGAAGYAHLYYQHKVKLYDTNPSVVNVWDYLIKATREDILGLPLLEYGVSLSSIDRLSQGERDFIGFWLARASATPRDKATSWSVNYPTRFWGEHIRKVIADQVDMINHWEVGLSSYADVENEVACWFIDPPYQEAGKFYPHHDIDYAHLATWCRSREGQVMVCEADGADWMDFKPLYTHKGIQRAERTEVWWCNEKPTTLYMELPDDATESEEKQDD